MAKHHFVVLVDQARWHVAHFVGRELSALRAFDSTDDSHSELLCWWQSFPRATLSFLTNLADEHYHVETLPHVRGAAGHQLLERKLAAWPFAQGMHAVFRLDRVQALRREDRFLFTALFCPPLSTLLSALQTKALRIKGVYTQALILATWLPALPKGVVHRLSIQCTQQQVRISYLRQQRLFFSRLLLLPQESFPDLEAWFGRIAQEANQVRMTLIQQRWLQEADVLQVMWLGQAPADVSMLKKYLPAHYLWACVPEPELARYLNDKCLPEDVCAMDWAAIHAVLCGQPLPNLAPEESLFTDSLIRMRRYLHWAGAVMISMMLLAGWAGMQVTQHTQLEVQQLHHQLRISQSGMRISDFSQEQLPRLHVLTQAVQNLESSLQLPTHTLGLLQNALAGLSHWQLTSLEWDAHFLAGQPDQDATKSLSVGQETLTAIWSNSGLNDQAMMEWQQLLSRLHHLPDVEKVEVLGPSGAAGGSQREGDTRQRLAPWHKPVLKLYFRHIGEAAAS